MSRGIRKKSESGIYHIMLRGINHQQIFMDDEDNQKFLRVLADCKQICGFELYAYCLMGNHVHLLIKEGTEPLDLVFKRIGSRFVYWYNVKYNRVGHLYQDRYKSCPVETDEYFLSAMRYIHQNPVKAKLVKDCMDYEYSSYNAYFRHNSLVDTEMALGMMSAEQFVDFHFYEDTNSHLEMEEQKIRLTDEDAQRIIRKYTGCNSAEEFRTLPPKKQKEYISILKQKHLSVRQISKLTGATRGVVQKAQKMTGDGPLSSFEKGKTDEY